MAYRQSLRFALAGVGLSALLFGVSGCGGGGAGSPSSTLPAPLPTPSPSASPRPSVSPSPSPTATPLRPTPAPTVSPTATPTVPPTATPAPTPTPTLAPTPTPDPFSDWPQYGEDLARSGYNPNETTIGTANVAQLHPLWKYPVGNVIDAQAVLATGIATASGTHDLVMVGSESGTFAALDATSGQLVWSQTLGSRTTSCGDLPGGVFGTTGSAAFDRAALRVYVADGNNTVWALNVATGQPVWHAALPVGSAQNHVYSGVAFNPSNGTLYVSTASYCDTSPWQGSITAINSASGSVGNTFYPASTLYGGTGSGGGIWGPVSASIDPTTGDVFVATGNSDPTSQPGAYNEAIVRLSSDLSRVVSSAVLLIGGDNDYGATPLIFQPAGCAPLVAAQNKTGNLEVDPRDNIGLPNQTTLAIVPPNSEGNGDFIGVPAFSPVTNFIYVGAYATLAPFSQGMNALSVNANCQLRQQWSTYVNTNPMNIDGNVPVSPPSVANGVVYFGSGVGNSLYAFNAQTGAQLWTSGALDAPVFAPPIVDVNLYVGAWDGYLYAFGIERAPAGARRRPAIRRP